MCTGSCSTPRQGLPGEHQDPPWFPWRHSRTKYLSSGDKAPARGACREGQPRHAKELAATRHALRQGNKAPARGACREGQPRHKSKVSKPRRQGPGKRSLPGRPTKASQGVCRDAPRIPARPGERQASGHDKTTTTARHLSRHATTPYLRSSASTNVSPWGLSRHVWREAVQPAVRGGKRR